MKLFKNYKTFSELYAGDKMYCVSIECIDNNITSLKVNIKEGEMVKSDGYILIYNYKGKQMSTPIHNWQASMTTPDGLVYNGFKSTDYIFSDEKAMKDWLKGIQQDIKSKIETALTYRGL